MTGEVLAGGGRASDWMHYVTAGIKTLTVTVVKNQEVPVSLGGKDSCTRPKKQKVFFDLSLWIPQRKYLFFFDDHVLLDHVCFVSAVQMGSKARNLRRNCHAKQQRQDISGLCWFHRLGPPGQRRRRSFQQANCSLNKTGRQKVQVHIERKPTGGLYLFCLGFFWVNLF